MAVNLKAVLLKQLDSLEMLDTDTLRERRYQRLMNYGYC
jgi:acetyl-CoA carboxylase carboxyl transferase subunit alpha